MMKVLGSALAVFLTLGLTAPAHTVRKPDTPSVSPAFAYSVETIPEVASTETILGVSPAALSIYAPFDQPFPTEWGTEAVQRSVPLIIAWEPWDWHLSPSDPAQAQYSLRSIASGAHDDYMRAWARNVAALNIPVLIRFAPEMNGDWTAWAGQRPDNTPEDFKNAWRHAQLIFRTENVHNARWIFNPSVVEGESIPMERYYPGSEQVDWLAVDGYNWNGFGGRPYQNALSVFSATVKRLRAMSTALPLMVAETGCPPEVKNRWVPDLAATAKKLGFSLVIWFEHNKETDWRLSTATFATPLPKTLAQSGWMVTGHILPVSG